MPAMNSHIQSTVENNTLEIELLKKDVAIITTLCEKFDVTIDKMQEIASNLSKMISLQEQRIENHEKNTKDVQGIIEMRRIEHNHDIKEIHSRITTTNRDLTEKIEQTEKKILEELHSMREELKKERTGFAERLSKVEYWKFMLVGGLIALTWVLARADLGKIFKLVFA
jgi:chromosome segregation ATPase